MRGESGASRNAEPDGDAGRGTSVQHAVEQFVELHSSGAAPDVKTFTERFPPELRPRILAQCREFLSFDGMLGHQEWEPGPQAKTPGRTFGDFVIQEELGRGGMGIVYLAHQRSLNRRIALKVMASGLTLSKRHVERFRREAAAAAQLRHPAIVPVHSLTEVDGTFALAMDFVAGRNLADLLDDLRLRNSESPTHIEGSLGIEPSLGHVAECAMFCAQIASALAVAHQAGIVHRDLKPRNLMIDDRRQPRLLDFGLAKSLGEGSISMSGEITGTAHYMSPEQTLAKRVVVDHRADIWALGVILYELLTLVRPFDGKNLQQVVYEICFKEPLPPHKRNPKVPRDLDTICQKALEKDPQNRYQTAAELEADLQRFLRWEPIHAKPAGALNRLGKWVRRHRTGTTIAAAATAIVLAVLGVLWYQAAQDDRRASQYLLEAEQHGDAGRFKEAIASVNQALDLRNDETTRSRLDVYYERSKTAATQQQREIAEARLLVNGSNQAIERDRELAIHLALAAADRLPSAETRSAVLEALGSGYHTTTLRLPDGATIHGGQVLGARWSPDGKRIVTTGADGKALVWDADTGSLASTMTGHDDKTWVVDPRFVANGARLLTGGADRTLRLWQTSDGRLLHTWPAPGAVLTLRTDRQGRRVLATSYGSPTGPWVAQVFDTESGSAISPPVAHGQIIRAGALSPDGEYAATWGGERGIVRLWGAGTGEVVASLAGHADDVQAITFAADSRLVATACMDGAARIFDVPQGRLLATVRHSRQIDALTFDADGTRLLTGSRDQTARLWQLSHEPPTGGLTASEERTFVGHGGRVHYVGFDASNALAVTAGQDGVLRIFDAGRGRASTSTEIMRYEVGTPVDSASFDPAGRRILAIASNRDVVVWDFGDTRGVVTLRQPGAVPAACFDATGNQVTTAGDDERLRLWNTRDGTPKWVTERLGNPVLTLDVDEAGERIACSLEDGRIAVHRLDDGAHLFGLEGHRGRVPIVRFAAAGSRLVTAGADIEPGACGSAIVWNTNNRSQVLVLRRPHFVAAADLSPDGKWLATVDHNEGVVRLWSVPSGEARGEIAGHGDAVTSVRFHPIDGQTLLTSSRDRTARLQRLDGSLVQTFAADHPLQHAAFARDGQRVLTSSAPGSFAAQLWNVADGTELLRFLGHRATVLSGAFSPDGAWAVTTSRDHTARIWPTDPVTTAKGLPLRPLTASEQSRHGLLRTSDRK